jgi:thiol:disulfide interchange protein DsbA
MSEVVLVADRRRVINIVLPLVGLGIIIFYSFCGSSCSYVKGVFFGIDLTYLGLAYAVLLLVLTLLKQDRLHIAALSLGLGVEVNLVAFQVKNSIFCPYCLIFAGIVVLLFVLNFRRSRVLLSGIAVVLGFLFFLLFFKGAAIPVYAEEMLIPSFGQGEVQVRLYTDYFCVPCSRMEPRIEPLLRSLVKNKSITLTLIDTPVHALTPLYARYYLYILSEDKRFESSMHSRSLLFEAARSKIWDKDRLEEFLKKNNVKFRQIDPHPTFAALSALITEDRVRATPTCVIIRDGKKAVFSGENEITSALELLR